MPNNRTKVDQLHGLMPSHFNTRNSPNWKVLIEAIGEQDQYLMDLLVAVKQQFFVKTASRPYLDNLAANVGVTRPKLLGMTDEAFQRYIPVMSYKPKQVRDIINQILDVFYFKESTTAYAISVSDTFSIPDGADLRYLVDEQNQESILFSASEFSDNTAATASEIASIINRQAKYSFAIDKYDNVTRQNAVEIFTNSIGSTGSIRITGGLANVALKFNGFIDAAGNGSDTEWTISKVGDTVTMQYTGGTDPNINQLSVGDVIISQLPGLVVNLLPQQAYGNKGSFVITGIDVASGKITFTNLFAVPGVYTQTTDLDVKFFRPVKNVAYTRSNRAGLWEVAPNQAIVEMPSSPPIVKRSLIGSQHINGASSTVTNIDVSRTSLTLSNGEDFPLSGNFFFRPVTQIISGNATSNSNGRIIGARTTYSYSSRAVLITTGNIAAGSATITNLASTVGLQLGQTVFADGVPQYATVIGIYLDTVTLSHPAAATSTGAQITFGGNVLSGITPMLPALASYNPIAPTAMSRTSNVVTITMPSPHGYSTGTGIVIVGCDGIVMQTVTGDFAVGSALMTNVSSTAGVAAGQLVLNPNVPFGAKIESVVGSTVFMSEAATGAAIGSTTTFNEDLNGGYTITAATATTFNFLKVGIDGSPSVLGDVLVEIPGISSTDGQVILAESVPNSTTRIQGSYAWDLAAPFVLSSNSGQLASSITAGTTVPVLNLNNSSIPEDSGGFLIFDYGLNTQEGPVRYLNAPTSSSLILDQSYIFQYEHNAGSYAIALSRRGPHVMSKLGTEYPAYMTNPSDVRTTLENLIKSVAGAGIYVQFLIKYPEQLYIGGGRNPYGA